MQSSRLTFLGHSTVLIEEGGVRLLTDPVLRGRIGPLRRLGRPADPMLHSAVDAVLISHAHWDHLDFPSLEMLGRETVVLVPRGLAALLRSRGFSAVHELAVGERFELGRLTLEATPAAHAGFRPPFGPSAEAIGFVIQGSRRIYFAGDTDLFAQMAAIGRDLDTALLPVWGWGPTLGRGHMDPTRAAEALAMLRPRSAVPIHWGSLWPVGMARVLRDRLTEPPRRFAALAAGRTPEVKIELIAPGERFTQRV